VTTEFKYLGSIIASNGKIQAEIENRCCKANQILGQLTPILRNKHGTLDTKRALYNTIFHPSLCYQCQTWTLTVTVKRKIVTIEMKCLRRILNVSKLDEIRNEIIRQRIGVTTVPDYIKKQQLKWFGHVSRSLPNCIIQRAVTLRYNGRRDKGRPRRHWIDDLADTTANIIQQISQQTPFSRYIIWHCHVLYISTLRCEASRDRENKTNKHVAMV
jgi:hypothetical protein